MSSRRDFIKKTTLGTLAVSSIFGLEGIAQNTDDKKSNSCQKSKKNLL